MPSRPGRHAARCSDCPAAGRRLRWPSRAASMRSKALSSVSPLRGRAIRHEPVSGSLNCTWPRGEVVLGPWALTCQVPRPSPRSLPMRRRPGCMPELRAIRLPVASGGRACAWRTPRGGGQWLQRRQRLKPSRTCGVPRGRGGPPRRGCGPAAIRRPTGVGRMHRWPRGRRDARTLAPGSRNRQPCG